MIKVIGIGGGGNNAVKNMYEKGIEGVDLVICNTDEQVLLKSPIPNKIQLGVKLTNGRGAGCDPEVGKEAALENIDEIKKILDNNTEMVFVTAGLGGGTGTGAAPIIAKEAKEKGILTVAIVTLPFKDEGDEPYKRALNGLQELRQYVDSLLIIDNQKLYEIYPDVSVFNAFDLADDIVTIAAKSIAELITIKGHINVDFADVKMVMANSGMALIGIGKAAGQNRAMLAAQRALESPLLNTSNISGAKNILVNITSGTKTPLKMSELGEVMSYINIQSGGKANFKRGVAKDESLDNGDGEEEGGAIGVTIIATGFPMSEFPILEFCNNPEDQKTVTVLKLNEDSSDVMHVTTKTKAIELEINPTVGQPIIGKPDDEPKISKPSAQSKDIFPVVKNLYSLNEAKLAELEEIPAYERAGVKLETVKIGDKNERSNITLVDGKHTLSEDNAFLDIDVD
ncbi:MAG: cell division protein FtsZ [Prevotellaceae bacterium]|nr:cell division protein FtsZ [Prevotellaceae bacterium]